jgi:hypothetical protein
MLLEISLSEIYRKGLLLATFVLAEAVLSGYLSNGKKIQFWDGKTAERIVQFLGRLR